MNKGITLSKKHGVNPILTYCPRCGGEGRDLLLVGKATEYECKNCKGIIIGIRPKICPYCKNSLGFTDLGEFDGSGKRLPGGLCETCEEELKQYKKIVEEGGIYWKCADCESEGVIKKNEFTERVREHAGIEPPNPVGIEFTEEECPICSKND